MCTMKDVKKIIKELDTVTGLNGASLELKEVKSIKTLGAFVNVNIKDRNTRKVIKREPRRFEFSHLVLSCDEKTLREIVKHEYAHYMAFMKYGERCHHDYRFKKMCEIIGATADEPQFTNDQIQKQSIKLAKYNLTCSGCGHTFTYSRMCGTLKAAMSGEAECPCGSKEFIFKQNH